MQLQHAARLRARPQAAARRCCVNVRATASVASKSVSGTMGLLKAEGK